MTRTIKTIAALTAVLLLLAGCTGQQSEKITKLEDLEGKTVAFMAIPIPVERMKNQLEKLIGVELKELLYFDTFQAALAALKSGKADAVQALEPVANYYTARDKDLASIVTETSEGQSSYRMALRAEDTELLAELNEALLSMREDGVLDALEQEFITGLQPDKQLVGKDMPRYDDAPTLHVGLSGDNPPIDYIAADGKPAGYNVELLARLSEMLHVNFEISVMPLETKFPALASKKIDIFFLHPINYSIKAITQTLEENGNISFSEPYYTFDCTIILVLK